MRGGRGARRRLSAQRKDYAFVTAATRPKAGGFPRWREKAPPTGPKGAEPPPHPPESGPGCSTWHDDVREAQLPGDGDAAGEEDHVLAPQLLDVAVQQLQGHRQACKSQPQSDAHPEGGRLLPSTGLVAMVAKDNNNSLDLCCPPASSSLPASHTLQANESWENKASGAVAASPGSAYTRTEAGTE